MTNKRILELIDAYMKANAAYQWDKAKEIFEEYKAEERREEEREERENKEKKEDA